MEVGGHCKDCGASFDAHWHNYPDNPLKPFCPKCKSYNVWTWTDESNDPPDDVVVSDEED